MFGYYDYAIKETFSYFLFLCKLVWFLIMFVFLFRIFIFNKRKDSIAIATEEVFKNTGLEITLTKTSSTKKKNNKKVLKPYLIYSKPNATGHSMGYKIPAGLSLADFKKRKDPLEHALRGEVKMWAENDMVHIKLMNEKLPQKIDYSNEIVENIRSSTLGASIGYTKSGYHVLDMADNEMNLLIGGYSGSGKSVFLRQVITTMMLVYSPQYVRFNLIDLKGGLEMSLFRDSIFVDRIAVDHDSTLEVLIAINNEMNKRYALMNSEGVNNIKDLETKFPYLVTVIDEYAEISPHCLNGEEKEVAKVIQNLLGRLLRMSRAAGIFLILCTQRPDAKVVEGQIRANIQAKISFRVRDGVNSRVIIDSTDAAELPPIPGRGVYQIQDNIEFQTPFLSVKHAKKLLTKRYKKFKVADINKKRQQKNDKKNSEII